MKVCRPRLASQRMQLVADPEGFDAREALRTSNWSLAAMFEAVKTAYEDEDMPLIAGDEEEASNENASPQQLRPPMNSHAKGDDV